MESLVEFQDLMTRMLSPENESRSAAEKQYEAIPVPHRASLLFLLFQQPNADVEVCVYMCVFGCGLDDPAEIDEYMLLFRNPIDTTFLH